MPKTDEELQQSALNWIIQEAERHRLPYQIVGGLAALAHGGSRALHDIDLYMPFCDSHWSDFLASVAPHVVWGPKSIVEGAWDLTYLKIDFHGQKIEIGDCANLKIRHHETGEWIDQVIDFKSSVQKPILNCNIDVMPLDQLIAYKKVLGRNVDKQDVRELTLEGEREL